MTYTGHKTRTMPDGQNEFFDSCANVVMNEYIEGD